MRETQPHFIWMDINLPRLNGVEALKILVHHPLTAHPTSLLCTIRLSLPTLGKGLEVGVFVMIDAALK